MASPISTPFLRAAGAVWVAGFSLALHQADDPLEDLFTRGRAAQASMAELRAAFTETSESPLLVEPLTATGFVTASPDPLRVVMEYATPDERTVTVDRTRLTIAWPDRDDAEQLNIATLQNRVHKYFVDTTLDELRGLFNMTLAHDPDVGDGTQHLGMVPARRQIAEGLERLDLWIDPERLLLVRMRMAFPGGETKTLEFHDIEVLRTGGLPASGGLPAILERPRGAAR